MGAAVLGWIVVGFLAGLAVNKLLNRRGEKATIEIALGIARAVIGGNPPPPGPRRCATRNQISYQSLTALRATRRA